MSMCSIFIVLAAILTGINVLNYQDMIRKIDNVNKMLIEHDGRFPERNPIPRDRPILKARRETEKPKEENFSIEMPYRIRYFSVKTDKNGEATETRTENIAAVSDDLAKDYAKKIVVQGKRKGFADVYRYEVKAMDDGYLIAFLDCEQDLHTFQSTLIISIIVSMAGVLAVFLLVWLFSKIVFKPVEEGYRKQKQFITDASHELKTPLTIMDANVEVLEMEAGENQWTKSLHHQVARMSGLVKQLVDLSRMDELDKEMEQTEFSFSDAVYEVVQSYEAVAKTQGKTLDLQMEEGLQYKGNEVWIRQAIGLLLDNAVKYSTVGATICISLQGRGKKCYLQIENPCECIGRGKKQELFERFYRLDDSHNSKTGGSGIGLSVVRSIVERHRGKIQAYSETGEDLKISVIL